MFKFTLSFVLLLISLSVSAQTDDWLAINLEQHVKTSWTKHELNNAMRVTDFVENLLNRHDFEYVLEHYNDSAYVQHNRNIPDKISGLVGFLREFVEDYPGVIHQNINFAICCQAMLNGCSDLVEISDIACNGRRYASVFIDFF